jgi:hypothetical protein
MSINGGTILGPPPRAVDKNLIVTNTVEAESSGRKCVKLSGIGQYVEFAALAAANTMVVRYSVPDTADGAGADYTLSLYVNGTFVRKVPVTSRYSWFYGSYTFSNNPGDGQPRDFYDEARVMNLSIGAGDFVRLQVDADDAAADYVIDYLRRPLQNYWMTREGQDFTTPVGAIFGPKAMIINMYAGSGGDALPWYFRDAKLGPLVGTRTWGGLVGIYDYPPLMDGGSVTAPRVAFYSPKGDWEVENHGVAPDYEVEQTPKDWASGHDPQLEKAVALVMDSLKKNPRPVAKRPAFPNYHTGQPTEGTPAAAGGGASGKKR